MFTGLVEEVGECLWFKRTSKAIQLTLVSRKIHVGLHTGDSIAVNGCCLTVSAHRKEQITFDLLEETLNFTNLGKLRPESPVNLERALLASGRVGGHFVQGHIDNVARVVSVGELGTDMKLEVELAPEYLAYVVRRGSICINGVSLTVAEISEASFAVWVIPHTRSRTNLKYLEAGSLVNLEFDLLAKYTERFLSRGVLPAVSYTHLTLPTIYSV